LKLCRPTSAFGGNHIYSQEGHIPQYSSAGVGAASFNPLYSKYPSNPNPYRNEPGFASPYSNYYRDASDVGPSGGGSSGAGGVRFGDDAQDIAYRNSKNSS
jgi:hypothetical protein